jgi:hypothetical protein
MVGREEGGGEGIKRRLYKAGNKFIIEVSRNQTW